MNFDDFGVPKAGILKNSDRGIKVQVTQEFGGPLLAFHMGETLFGTFSIFCQNGCFKPRIFQKKSKSGKEFSPQVSKYGGNNLEISVFPHDGWGETTPALGDT